MIVSASYRTDIPAFYAEWFRRRLDAGYCRVANPYNARQVSRIDLTPDACDGFVFWTKNLGRFGPTLADLRAADRPFVVQFTINGYPRTVEAAVTDERRAIEQVRELATRYGPRVAVWRYDPILFTSVTDAAVHRGTFARIARALERSVDEVVVSFAHVYRKTRRNLDRRAAETDFTWSDPPRGEKLALLADLVQIARDHGMRLTVCSQADVTTGGAEAARCIDADRLTDVAGRPIRARTSGNRPDCLCHASRDIGAYDSCPHGCAYCYAVADHARAAAQFRAHDPDRDALAPTKD